MERGYRRCVARFQNPFLEVISSSYCNTIGFASCVLAVMRNTKANGHKRQKTSMIKRFLEILNKYAAGVVVVTFVAVINFLYYCFPPDTLVPVWIVFLVLIVAFAFVLGIYAFCQTKIIRTGSKGSIAIRSFVEQGGRLIAVTDSCDAFRVNTVVQLYSQEYGGDFEKAVAWGYVETINEKGHPQIVISGLSNDDSDLEKLQKEKGKYVIRLSMDYRFLLQRSMLNDQYKSHQGNR